MKKPCLDPTKMHGYCDQFGGSDFPDPDPTPPSIEEQRMHAKIVSWLECGPVPQLTVENVKDLQSTLKRVWDSDSPSNFDVNLW